MEQNNSLSVSVVPGMRDDLEPHAAPAGTITVARNVRFPTVGVITPRRGLAGISAGTLADVSYSSVLNTAQGPDFLHPCTDGFVFGAAGFGYRYNSTLGFVSVAGSYSTAQPRGIVDTITRQELTPSDQIILTPWPLSQAANGTLLAVCHSVGNGQPSGNFGTIVGPQSDGYSGVVTPAGPVIRVFTEEGALISSSSFDNMESAMVVEDGLTGALVIIGQSATALVMRVINAGGGIGAAVAIGTLVNANCYYAACTFPGVGIGLVYQSAVGTLSVKTLTSVAGVVSSTTMVTVLGAVAVPVSCYADATNLYVGWALRGTASYDAQAIVYNTTLSTITSTTLFTVQALGSANAYLGPPLFGPSVNSGNALALVAYVRSNQPKVAFHYTTAYEITAAGTVTTGQINRGVLPMSAPFNNGMWWARLGTAVFLGGIQSTRNVLLDFQENRSAESTAAYCLQYPKVDLVCDNYAFGDTQGQNPPANVYMQHLHPPTQLASGEWVMGMPKLVREESMIDPAGSQAGGYLVLCEWLKFATGCEQQVRTVGGDVVVSGTLTSVSAGVGMYQYSTGGTSLARPSQGLDLGLLQPPSLLSPVASTTVDGDLTVTGVYQYRAVTEVIDALGRRWQSAPSNVVPITLAGTENTVTLTLEAWFPLLRSFSILPANCRAVIHIYRTLAGQAPFQRCTPPQGAPIPAVSTGEATWIDELPDSLLAAREFLYTDGGALAHDHPPSCRFMAVTEDRVWLAGLWNVGLAQSSKIIVPGEPVQFSDLDSFKVFIPETITGLASQDGVVIIFAASAVYVVQGIGPNDQGQGAWDTPRCISRSTGCIDWRSIAETSIGVFFQSERGIMLLPRGAGEPLFIGMPVESLLESLGPTITGAAVCQTSESNTVRFCTSGGTIVYDLETSAWSYDTPPADVVHTKVCDTDDGPTYGRRALLISNGFDQETAGWADDAATIPSYVEWAPLHPEKLAGWVAFTGAISAFGKLDGQAYPTTSLTASCNIDANTTNSRTKTTMADMGDIDYRRLPLGSVRQGSAATLSFATAGAPWRFVGWTVELEPQQGTRNVRPATEQY